MTNMTEKQVTASTPASDRERREEKEQPEEQVVVEMFDPRPKTNLAGLYPIISKKIHDINLK